ncbi:MAG TPA: DNA mismatch repair endonuclease MutL, partial [Bacteroidales bacterium]|nr:DNA mismatch repair endonuclease MutL [Bacteroidales bacterium]
MLKVLPSHVSNLIAAGEVVQRPASVVKELMENAVDAGAKSIRVLIKDSGRTLIQVIDDGCGMSPLDAELAFERHATSKIEEIEDLEKLGTFGFRGEALASIASVAEVTLRTRRAEDAVGSEVKFSESRLTHHSEISSPVGSNFIVRNIFYNIPARRKFLKSDSSEYRQILSEFTRVALTRPDLSFYFTNNGTEIYNLPPSNLRQRIQGIAGKELGKELVELSVDTTIVKIKGYIGKPEDSRKTPGNQYFFVNG